MFVVGTVRVLLIFFFAETLSSSPCHIHRQLAAIVSLKYYEMSDDRQHHGSADSVGCFLSAFFVFILSPSDNRPGVRSLHQPHLSVSTGYSLFIIFSIFRDKVNIIMCARTRYSDPFVLNTIRRVLQSCYHQQRSVGRLVVLLCDYFANDSGRCVRGARPLPMKTCV